MNVLLLPRLLLLLGMAQAARCQSTVRINSNECRSAEDLQSDLLHEIKKTIDQQHIEIHLVEMRLKNIENEVSQLLEQMSTGKLQRMFAMIRVM